MREKRSRPAPSFGIKLSLMIALALAAMAAAKPSRAQLALPASGVWVQNSPPISPSGRDNAAMAYDAGNQRVVLFGGLDASQRVLDDTWEWDGISANWLELDPALRPPARCCAAMDYDPVSGNTVLFGGSGASATMLGDTWTWDGSTWTAANPPTSPPARDGASMVYDAARGAILLFGGLGADGGLLSDTWSWDGANWTLLQPASSPPPRSSAALVYDPDTQAALLFGGCCDMSPGAPAGTYLGDTWRWDGATWSPLLPAESPSPRSSAATAYDPILGMVLLFGGCGTAPGACRLGDTWLWDPGSVSWLPEALPAGPPGRTNAAMAADGASRTLVLFGGLEAGPAGLDVYGADTWSWVSSLPRAQP
jgi:hypothetical protein